VFQVVVYGVFVTVIDPQTCLAQTRGCGLSTLVEEPVSEIFRDAAIGQLATAILQSPEIKKLCLFAGLDDLRVLREVIVEANVGARVPHTFTSVPQQEQSQFPMT
jgi:hypothetical protein